MFVRRLDDCASDWIEYPGTRTRGWPGGDLLLDDSGTHFAYIAGGSARVTTDSAQFDVPAGWFFAAPGAARLSGEGRALLVTRLDYRGIFTLGGPVEELGRLRYIDGCSDTLLIAPLLAGDPCLNMLYVPGGIDQTAHTHPSIRVGIVISGQGVCRTPKGEETMLPSNVFVLPTDAVHSFHTGSDHLRIVVYHPDSDCGPSDTAHPMISRTIVEGVRASNIDGIRTETIRR